MANSTAWACFKYSMMLAINTLIISILEEIKLQIIW